MTEPTAIGSRLEPVPDHLAGAVLSVDLGALAANWRTLAAASGAAECSAVIKADAYGVGLEPAARTLAAAGCRTFFVAHAVEALRARAAAPQARVFMLNGLPPGAGPQLAAAGVLPVLGSLAEIDEWRRAADGAPFAVHVDTGMNRLGLTAQETSALAAGPQGDIALVMSHFVCSEDADNPLNSDQLGRFAAARALFPGVAASLCNSSGIYLPQRPHYELTRPGYALYGGNPCPGQRNPMRPVVEARARIIQTRTVEPGETVGYNARWRAQARAHIAIISLGYADGYLRAGSVSRAADGACSTGGAALAGGVLCPFVGAISMDLIAIDVSAAPADAARAGGFVTLVGGDLDVDAVGARLGSIGYEVLTSLGRRYARHYVNGACPPA